LPPPERLWFRCSLRVSVCPCVCKISQTVLNGFLMTFVTNLRVPERIVFIKVAVQTYRALHGDAPQYPRQFTSVADIPTRQRLRSSTSDDLCVPAVRLPTVGRRAFSVAGARVWNALPADVTSAHSLRTFRNRLKVRLFPLSYPGLDLYINFFSLCGPCGSCLLLRPP